MGTGDKQAQKKQVQQKHNMEQIQKNEPYMRGPLLGNYEGYLIDSEMSGIETSHVASFLDNIVIQSGNEATRRETMASKNMDASHHWGKTRKKRMRTSADQLGNLYQLSSSLKSEFKNNNQKLTSSQRVSKLENLFEKTYEADANFAEGFSKTQEDEDRIKKQAKIVQYKNLIHLYSEEIGTEANAEKHDSELVSKLINTSVKYHNLVKETNGNVENGSAIDIFGLALSKLSKRLIIKSGKENPSLVTGGESMKLEINNCVKEAEKKLGLHVTDENAEVLLSFRRNAIRDAYQELNAFKQDRDKKIVNGDNKVRLPLEVNDEIIKNNDLGLIDNIKNYQLFDLTETNILVHDLIQKHFNKGDYYQKEHVTRLKETYDRIIERLIPMMEAANVDEILDDMFIQENISPITKRKLSTSISSQDYDTIEKMKESMKEAKAYVEFIKFELTGEKLDPFVKPFEKDVHLRLNEEDYKNA